MLNAKAVKALKPKEKQYKTADKDGLYVLTRGNGKKLWQYKYKFAGKEKVFSYGPYPEVSLLEARQKHEVVRKQVRDGVDPMAKKKADAESLIGKYEHTFKVVAERWYKRESRQWIPKHAAKVWHDVERDLFPMLGNLPVADIKTPVLLKVVKSIEDRGALDVALRAKNRITGILKYAVQHGLIEHNPGVSLAGIVSRPVTKHRAAVQSSEVGELVRRINAYKDEYKGKILTELALKLTLYTFLRSVEIRGARWSEFNLGKSEWLVPPARDDTKKSGGMKARKEHIVPLSRQALEVLNSVRELDLSDDLVFPIRIGSKTIMSENTMNHALNKMGYKDRHTVHGFRTVASTLLSEGDKKHKWSSDAIERQLAHSPASSNAVRDAYNRFEYLEERSTMMQWYADRLDALAEGAMVVQFKRAPTRA